MQRLPISPAPSLDTREIPLAFFSIFCCIQCRMITSLSADCLTQRGYESIFIVACDTGVLSFCGIAKDLSYLRLPATTSPKKPFTGGFLQAGRKISPGGRPGTHF